MRLRCLLILSVLFICLTSQTIVGQVTVDSISADTMVPHKKKGSIFSGRPGKSMLMSLVVPGAGQIYNKSYLRVPFVWGAVGGMGYLVHYNTQKYNCLRDAYKASIDMVPYEFPSHCDEYVGITNSSQLRILRDDANEARQLSIVGFTLVWLANGIDAFVNAHLKEFDLDEDLSIRVGTKMDDDPYNPMRMGIFVQF
ncbi:MAG TPA: DUF5683 domain-containing protein [Saprospiraceae bacterium]|nr:DUF5683 domain-containing protein [Saprospiraceae bacterium]HQW24669.1 DUF5683 domain-containing protein [Saprospiraceae bacterium]